MKKLLCILLAVLILPAGALAVDVSGVNDYLSVFGEPELSGGTVNGNFTIYTAGSCRVLFRDGGSSIFVDGGGANFLALCTAAAMSLEADNSGFTYNAGVILSNYLLARGSEEEKITFTQGGNAIIFSPQNGGIVFVVSGK